MCDSVKCTVKNSGGRPDYPCSVPFHGVKTPAKIDCGYNAPINRGDGFHFLFGKFLFDGVIVLLKELFGGFPGNSGADKNINSGGNHHKGEANAEKNFAVGFFKECENQNGKSRKNTEAGSENAVADVFVVKAVLEFFYHSLNAVGKLKGLFSRYSYLSVFMPLVMKRATAPATRSRRVMIPIPAAGNFWLKKNV